MSELFSTYEFVVAQKAEGRFLFRKILFMSLYILYIAVFLTVGLVTRIAVPLLALIPVTVWIISFFTWRYTNVEYEYSMTSGVLTFTEIYGGRSRKKIAEFRIKDAIAILPLDDEATAKQVERFNPIVNYCAIPSKEARDTYVLLCVDESVKIGGKGRHVAFTFVATGQALKIMKYYNPTATVVTQVSL